MQRPYILSIILILICMLAGFAATYHITAKNNEATAEKLAQLQSLIEKNAAIAATSPTETAIAPQTSTSPAANSSASTGDNIGAIFSPEEPSSTNASIDKIKADFESLFVTYQFLHHCNLTQAYDYHLINSALAHEISSKNAPGRIQYDILTAAKGSYQEIYSRSACDTPEIQEMNQKFRSYIEQISKLRFVIE